MADPKELTIDEKIEAAVKKAVEANQATNDIKFNALQKSIEEVNKTAEAAGDTSLVQKKVKPKKLAELEVNGKTYRAKAHAFKTKSESGDPEAVALSGMTKAELTKVFKSNPTMFVEVD